jgi:hypothetical protein
VVIYTGSLAFQHTSLCAAAYPADG